MNENLAKKSGLSRVRSSVIVIRSAYFGAQKRRKYAKNVGVSRSVQVKKWWKYSFGNNILGEITFLAK